MIYFASDFHFGIPDHATSLDREKRVCRWLDQTAMDATAIFLVGDLFDVWFEYRHVVPRGHTRFLGKLAELSDRGIAIEAFTGNHDLWMRDYFLTELNIPVHHAPIRRTYSGRQFFIGHGDGLGPGDHGYKLLKKILRNPASQWLYRRLHPDFGIGIASRLSRMGPKHTEDSKEVFLGPDREWLVQYSEEVLQKENIDFFIFGHRHLPIDHTLSNGSRYINLGDGSNTTVTQSSTVLTCT